MGLPLNSAPKWGPGGPFEPSPLRLAPETGEGGVSAILVGPSHGARGSWTNAVMLSKLRPTLSATCRLGRYKAPVPPSFVLQENQFALVELSMAEPMEVTQSGVSILDGDWSSQRNPFSLGRLKVRSRQEEVLGEVLRDGRGRARLQPRLPCLTDATLPPTTHCLNVQSHKSLQPERGGPTRPLVLPPLSEEDRCLAWQGSSWELL